MFTIDGKTYDKRVDYDRHIIEHADFFTIVSRAGHGRLRRHKRRTLTEARKLAQTLANRFRKTQIVYATYGSLGCHVANFRPED